MQYYRHRLHLGSIQEGIYEEPLSACIHIVNVLLRGCQCLFRIGLEQRRRNSLSRTFFARYTFPIPAAPNESTTS